MKRRLLLGGLAGLAWALIFGAALAVAGDAGPQTPCQAYYTVQWGDTLTKVAARNRMSLGELLQLNRGRVRNPDLIYAGQILCIPAQRQVSLQVTYHFRSGKDESANELLARGGLLGRNASYPVQSADMFSTTYEVTSTFAVFPPLMLGVRNGPHATNYTLYAIGDGRPLLPLVLTDTKTLTTVLPLQTDTCNTQRFFLLGGGLSDVATATLRLETGDAYLPFDLTRLAFYPTLERALDCVDETQIGFALAPAGPKYPGAYYVVMFMEDGIVGPFGSTRALNCTRWSGWGWFYRWLRGWYGC